ncbi:MAG: DnaB-like helicase C-terminal domain-containing protein, partial [Pseudomonadota bacterium]
AAPVTVKSFMAEDEGLTALGGAEYLAQLANGVVSLRAAADYAATIRELALRRQTIDVGNALIEDARTYDPDRSPEMIVEDGADRLTEVLGQLTATSRPPTVSLTAAATSAVRHIGAAMKGGPRAKTAWPALNEVIGGLMDGSLTVIAGRPSMGKSALAVSLARHLAASGQRSIYATLEMTPEEVTLRMLSEHLYLNRRQQIAFRRMLQGAVGPEEFHSLIEALRDDVGDDPVQFVDQHVRKLPRLLTEITKAVGSARRRGESIGAVFVDYIGLLQSANPRASRYELITETTASLKALAGELRCPVVALSQLSRQVEAREDKRPLLSDLRESGSVEQDADNVLFVYREQYYLERTEPPEDSPQWAEWQAAFERCQGLMSINIAKQRNGPVGSVDLRYEPGFNAIWDAGVPS